MKGGMSIHMQTKIKTSFAALPEIKLHKKML